MSRTSELDGMNGPGVEVLKLPDVDKAINKYQRKKDARCAISPDEIAAKNELKAVLHEHRAELPVNSEGVPFYRYDERDYFLEERLKIRKLETDEDEE